jgi:diguanylate cyclase (GGDEF)-like protein
VSHTQAGFFDSWHQNALYLFAESLAQLLRNFRLVRSIDRKVAAQTDALQQALAEAEKLRERFEQLAIVDELTGLHNRRHFFHEAPRIVAAAQRDGTPLSLVIADLDEFKRVNDTWGHTVGDQVLVRTAEVIETELRGGDLLARLGGEEFGLLLPNTDPAGAMHLADRINRRLPTLPIGDPTAAWQLTGSFGIAELTPELNRLAVTDVLGLLYARADKAMYKCKTSGRARAEVYRPETNLE